MGQALCCVQVEQSTVAMKERFGRFEEVLDPGCHFVPWCFGSQIVGRLSLRVQKLDVRCETKSKDNVFVTVIASVQFRALGNNASDAFYKLSNPREQIQAYVFDGGHNYSPPHRPHCFSSIKELWKLLWDENVSMYLHFLNVFPVGEELVQNAVSRTLTHGALINQSGSY
eukprot:Gb_03977 [translate_table: standard]